MPELHPVLSVLVVLFLVARSQSARQNFREIEKTILDRILGQNRYDSRIRPLGANKTDGTCQVRIDVFIRSISKIDDINMEYSVQLTLREQWMDERMQFDDIYGSIHYLTLTDPSKIWKPDLFFTNEKDGHFHDIIMPNVLLRIYPKGEVLFSIRISLVLSCPMDLKYYPLDKQTCNIQMASYGYTCDELRFVWKDGDPVQLNKDLHLPRFTLKGFKTDYCTSTTNTGTYSCIVIELSFQREFSYYLIQIYIPCCMLVIVSWVSFWLDQNAIPARVSLGVTTLLTMATHISGINLSLPPVSYTKAIDVWTGVCLTFVFGALLEFALVNYISRTDEQKKEEWSQDVDHIEDGIPAFAMKPLVANHNNIQHSKSCELYVHTSYPNYCIAWLAKFPSRSKRIDIISRLFFPIMFALFNLIYWTTYLFREEN